MKLKSIIIVIMLLSFTFIVPAQAQSSFSNVKVIFATSSTLPQNTKELTWGEIHYSVLDQTFYHPACLRPVWVYGAQIPNGVVLEFQGNIYDNSSLAYQCFNVVTSGSCARVSGVIESSPDVWGAKYFVTSINYNC